MTVEQIKELAKIMREYGVAKLTMPELSMELQAVAIELPRVVTPIDAPVEESKEIKHEEHVVSSLLKLNDIDLVDRLFPEPRDPLEVTNEL